MCLYSSVVNNHVPNWLSPVDFGFSVIIIICGITVNSKFLKKLREEKRNTPPNRKGNVIEPIMRWFCVIQMIYWPYHLLYFWNRENQIIPSEYMDGWWCNAFAIGMKFGRMIVGYNSLFVALIRYIYIVHRKKANQWEFENVGRWFQIASIAVPVAMQSVKLFTDDLWLSPLRTEPKFIECIASQQGLNSTENLDIPKRATEEWALKYVPENIIFGINCVCTFISVVVFLNLTEGFFYLRIYQCISR